MLLMFILLAASVDVPGNGSGSRAPSTFMTYAPATGDSLFAELTFQTPATRIFDWNKALAAGRSESDAMRIERRDAIVFGLQDCRYPSKSAILR